MVNKDRIVPVTRTDLVTLFCTIYNMSHEVAIRIIPVVDGAPAFGPFPPAATAVCIAGEPIKSIGDIPEVAAFYFLPAYDFDTDGVDFVDPNGDKFVPNPGVLYLAGEGSIVEVATGFEYGPAEP